MRVRRLREKYLQSDVRFTIRVLLDTHIQMVEEISDQLKVKARWLKAAFVFLTLAILAGLVPWR
ncbi:MAG: hypothetical protein ABR507_09400 [Actinomycetota bacterium]